MTGEKPKLQPVACPTCNRVFADLSSALSHSRSVHKSITETGIAEAWVCLGCHVCHDCHLPFRRPHQCTGSPSYATERAPGRGRPRARPVPGNAPLSVAASMPKKRAPTPHWQPPGLDKQATAWPHPLSAQCAGLVHRDAHAAARALRATHSPAAGRPGGNRPRSCRNRAAMPGMHAWPRYRTPLLHAWRVTADLRQPLL